MSEPTICAVCYTEARWAWCDQHGVAQCVKCGAPYRLFHYEGEGDTRKRVERPPEMLLDDDDVAAARRCFADTGAKLSAVGMGLSFNGGYDVANTYDHERGAEWWAQHRHSPRKAT